MQLVPITTLETIEHALLARQIADLANELEQLQRELAPLERAFTTFEQRVARQSAAATVERDRLRQLCREIEQFTLRLHARLVADPDGLMDAIFTPDELRHIGELFGIEVPEDWFGPELRSTTSGAGRYNGDESNPNGQDSRVTSPVREEPPNLRHLYRQLARIFHPDLTTDPAEHHFRQEMMLRINGAWDMRDVHTMQAIRDDVRDLMAGHLLSADAYRLAWKRRELAQLLQACSTCRHRIDALRFSKTISLWHDPALANAAIARHIRRLEQEIEFLAIQRDAVVEEFRLALATWATHRM